MYVYNYIGHVTYVVTQAVCMNMQVNSGDTLPGPEGVEISLLPSESVNGETQIRHVYTIMEGRCVCMFITWL